MQESAYPQFQHHGAADGVTGSCHRYIASDELHLLVDCGLFQGQEEHKAGVQGQKIDFDISRVMALIVTHVHIDHIGRLPYLFAAGFKGPILCSVPSARLLPLVIEDALKMGFTRDQTLVNSFLESVQSRLLPLAYRQWYPLRNTDCLQLKLRLQPAGHILGSAYVEIDLQWRVSHSEAWQSHRTVFSGDLGAPYAPLLPAPKSPYRADTLVIESTYGDSQHEDRKSRRLRLQSLVERALSDGGSVLIPAFSIGRTQDLLYEFESIIHTVSALQAKRAEEAAFACKQAPTPTEPSMNVPTKNAASVGACLQANNADKDAIAGRQGTAQKESAEKNSPWLGSKEWGDLMVIVDSPLAAKFTKVYQELKPFWDKEALQLVRSGRHPLNFESLLTVDSHDDHMRVVKYLAETQRPAIVIAASGMAAGGRIVNYLKAMLEDARHNVLFVGFQVPGTPGHNILQAAPTKTVAKAVGGRDGRGSKSSPAGRLLQEEHSVMLDGERYTVRAGVEMVGGYSAHADQGNLLGFVRNMRHWPSQIRIVHGNDKARSALRQKFVEMAARKGRSVEVVLPTKE